MTLSDDDLAKVRRNMEKALWSFTAYREADNGVDGAKEWFDSETTRLLEEDRDGFAVALSELVNGFLNICRALVMGLADKSEKTEEEVIALLRRGIETFTMPGESDS